MGPPSFHAGDQANALLKAFRSTGRVRAGVELIQIVRKGQFMVEAIDCNGDLLRLQPFGPRMYSQRLRLFHERLVLVRLPEPIRHPTGSNVHQSSWALPEIFLIG